MQPFKEKQGFGALSIIIALEAVIMCVLVIAIDFQKGEWTSSIIVIPIIVLVNSLLLGIRLKTEINIQHVKISYWPFTRKTIYWRDIQKAEVIKYGWVGGWGIKKSKQYGTVYNTQGDKGLFLLLNNGQKITIGTNRPKELETSLSAILHRLANQP